MPKATNAQLDAQLSVLVVVLMHVCEALPAATAAAVSSSVQRTLAGFAPASGDDADAAQAAILTPLLTALRR